MRGLIRNGSFITLSGAGVISEMGDWLSFLALNILLYTSTHSSLALSGLFLARTLPGLMLGPFVGVWLDRWPRRVVLVIADIVRAMTLLSVPPIFALSHSSIYLYIIIAVNAAAALFFLPARLAFIPEIVQEPLLLRANALTSSLSDAISIIGPGFAGAIIALFNTNIAFIGDSISFFISACCLLMIRHHSVGPSQTTSTITSFRQDFTEGFAFLRHQPTVLMICLLTTVTMLGGGAINALFVIYAQQILKTSATGYGLLFSSLGLGFLLGSLLMSISGRWLRKEQGFTLGIVMVSFAPILWVLFRQLPAAILICIANGIGNSVWNISSNTLLQVQVPSKLQGRVFGLFSFLTTIASALSMGLAGLLAYSTSVTTIFFAAGLLELFAAVLAFVWKARS